MGCSPWGRKESETTEWLADTHSLILLLSRITAYSSSLECRFNDPCLTNRMWWKWWPVTSETLSNKMEFSFLCFLSGHLLFSSVQFTSVAQSCLTLCDPMNCSTPGLPVHHQFPEFTQTHVHWVGDAIQPSHPLSSPSPPAPNPSQHQRLFQWVNSSHEMAKVLEFQL